MNPSGSSTALRDQVAVVTGAGSGIGEATARLLCLHGARVIVADIDPLAAHRVAHDLQKKGGEALDIVLDVTSESSWENLQTIVAKSWNRWDVLVNSAGISFAKPIAETSLHDWRRVHAVNLDGIFLGLRAALPLMGRRGNVSGGAVINIASLSGLVPFPGASAYASSKAAVIQLSRVAALECQQHGSGTRVHAVVPGGVKTPMWRTMPFFQRRAELDGEEAAWQSVDPRDQFLQPEEIAAAVLELVAQPDLHPNGGTWILDRKGSRGRIVSLEEAAKTDALNQGTENRI